MEQKNFQKIYWRNREKTATENRHWIRLTRVCNNNCIFCLDKDEQDGTIIPFSKIEEELKKGREQNCVRAILSGGEPTLHPDYVKIIKKAKEEGYSWVQTVSNGRMFAYQDFLRDCIRAGLNEITFTIPGHNRKLFETQTRAEGSYRQTLNGLINALRTSLIVSSDIVINKFTYKYLFEIIKFYVNLGVREFDLLQVTPYGNAWYYKDKVLYDLNKAFPYLKKAFDYAAKVDFFIWTNRFPPQFLEGYEELIQDPHKLYAEVKGRKEDFEKVIKGEMEMKKAAGCYPERCPYCFWQNFAKTVVELRDIRRNLDKIKFSEKSRGRKNMIKQKKDFKKIKFGNAGEYEIFVNKQTEDWIIKNQQKIKEMKGKIVFTQENHLLLSESVENDINLRDFFQKIKVKGIRIKNIPLCFYPSGKLVERGAENLAFLKNEVNIYKIVGWYIVNRYYTKSLRCKKCRYNRTCLGMQINYIRNFGYKLMKPIK